MRDRERADREWHRKRVVEREREKEKEGVCGREKGSLLTRLTDQRSSEKGREIWRDRRETVSERG